MSERGEAVRRPARAPRPARSRKRWTIAAGVAAAWVVLLLVTGSVTGATVLLVVIAGLGVAAVFGLRALGVTRDHPWIQRLESRPWRDGQEVLQRALRHLSEVFVVTPSGALLAPNVVDLRMNPEDLRSLGEQMEPALVMASATEVYEEQVAEHGARYARPAPAEVHIIADPSVPPGRYTLRQGQPVNAGDQPGLPLSPGAPEPVPPGRPAYDGPAYDGPVHNSPAYDGPAYDGPAYEGPAYNGAAYNGAAGDRPGSGGPGYAGPPPHEGPRRPLFAGSDGSTIAQPSPGRGPGSGLPTMMEQTHRPIPPLRLLTGGAVAETSVSGARAGRGEVELGLPEVRTVSREHARFTFSDGQWWVTNLGMNGLTVNGDPVAGERPVSNGDEIRWGTRPDALLSQVQIG